MVAPLVAAVAKAHVTTAVKAKATVKVAKFKAAAAAIKAKANIASYRYLHRCYYAYNKYINYYHRRLNYLNRRYPGKYTGHKRVAYTRALRGFKLRSHWVARGYHHARHGRLVSLKWWRYNRAMYYRARHYAIYWLRRGHAYARHGNRRAASICYRRYHLGVRHMRYRAHWMRVWARKYHIYARYQRALHSAYYRNRSYWRRFYAYFSRRVVKPRWAM